MAINLDEAFRAFNRWVKEHDPDGEMDIIEQSNAYYEWSKNNSIEKYLDKAQPVGGLSPDGLSQRRG